MKGAQSFLLLAVHLLFVEWHVCKLLCSNTLHSGYRKKVIDGDKYSASKCFLMLFTCYNDHTINDDIINDRRKRTIGRNYTLKGST